MQKIALLPGETPINNAPQISLENGNNCIPQHYLKYQHDLTSMSRVIADIDYSAHYPIFLNEESGCHYIQIGIIGPDNYSNQASKKDKIVYGRKWRIEKELPTSELIQTVFLAIKKAREHEIRELFTLKHNDRVSTPFNSHHDLPLMARNSELLKACTTPDQIKTATDIEHALAKVKFNDDVFKVEQITPIHNELWCIQLSIQSESISFLLTDMSVNHLYYQLMDALLQQSDRHVDEHFTYQGFPRFSRANTVHAIADLSVTLRTPALSHSFKDEFTQANYAIDTGRVPKLGNDAASIKAAKIIKKFLPLDGIVPLLNI